TPSAAGATPPATLQTPETKVRPKADPPVVAPNPAGKEAALRSVAWAPQGPWLATTLTVNLDSTIFLFDTRTWTCARRLPAQGVSSVSWSPDGTRLAVSGTQGFLRTWSVQGTATTNFKHPANSVQAVAWSPDGKLLASGDS